MPDTPELVIHPDHAQAVRIGLGCGQPVTLDKMFGPLIFAHLRATADFATNDWIIERQRIDSGEWEIVARIPGQCDHEFDESHPEHREIPDLPTHGVKPGT